MDVTKGHKGKIIKVLLVKTSMDGHWRGLGVVSTALRNAGMEVIYGGVMDAAQIVTAAKQEDVDVIGMNIGGGYENARQVMEMLGKEKGFHPVVVAGGTIPQVDIPELKKLGIEVFPPGSRLDSIVQYIESATAK